MAFIYYTRQDSLGSVLSKAVKKAAGVATKVIAPVIAGPLALVGAVVGGSPKMPTALVEPALTVEQEQAIEQAEKDAARKAAMLIPGVPNMYLAIAGIAIITLGTTTYFITRKRRSRR